MAVQGSFALMGDSRPYSLVFCHAHGAQILEFRWLAVPIHFCGVFWGRVEKAGNDFVFRQLFIHR